MKAIEEAANRHESNVCRNGESGMHMVKSGIGENVMSA
jgi:hypothetical protein